MHVLSLIVSVVIAAVDPTIGAILLGPLVTYLVVARRLSGKIKNSDATELWNESRAMREWSAERITDLMKSTTRLEVRIETLEGQNHKLEITNAQLVIQLRDALVELELCRQRVLELETKLADGSTGTH